MGLSSKSRGAAEKLPASLEELLVAQGRGRAAALASQTPTCPYGGGGVHDRFLARQWREGYAEAIVDAMDAAGSFDHVK